MDKEKDLQAELREIQQRRTEIEEEYRQVTRQIEEADEELLYKKSTLARLMNDESPMKPDSALLDIYQDRDSLLTSERNNQRDFYDEVERKFNSNVRELDEKEKGILDKIDNEDR